jgi:putative heme-binding domain-containing protein
LRSICESVLDVRPLNTTAARGLSQFDDPAIAKQLIKNYRRFDGPDRPAVLEILASRPSSAAALLEHVASKESSIALLEITPYHARQILNLGDKSLASQLSEVWGELRDSPEDQRKLIARLREQLTPATIQQANLTRGRELYTKTCSQCHVLYGEGGKVGPDLTGSQRTSLDYLLENIVDPSAVVGKDYRMTNILMTNGSVLSGLVMSQDDKTLVLQTPTDQRTIAKEDIDEIKASTLSAMPAGLLETLTPEQTRDLIGYLMHPVQVQ